MRGPTMWALCSWNLQYLDSDTDASVVIVLLQWLNQLQNYSRDTSKNYQLNTCSINSHESRARPILPEDTFQTSLTSLYVAVFLKNDKGQGETGLETRLVQTAQRARETESGGSEEALSLEMEENATEAEKNATEAEKKSLVEKVGLSCSYFGMLH